MAIKLEGGGPLVDKLFFFAASLTYYFLILMFVIHIVFRIHIILGTLDPDPCCKNVWKWKISSFTL